MDHDITADTIDALRRDTDGLVVSRSRVIDGLLDLRLAAGADSRRVARIDERLASVPGVTTVDAVWWRATLDELAARESVGEPV